MPIFLERPIGKRLLNNFARHNLSLAALLERLARDICSNMTLLDTICKESLDSQPCFTVHTISVKIGQLAKKAEISVSTVRFYEAQGLMPKPQTRDGGYREYEQSDLERLRLILAAKRQRFLLKLIRTALDAVDQEPEPCREVANLVKERIKAIGREIHDLQRLQAHLEGQLIAWERGSLPKAECLCAILQTDALQPK